MRKLSLDEDSHFPPLPAKALAEAGHISHFPLKNKKAPTPSSSKAPKPKTQKGLDKFVRKCYFQPAMAAYTFRTIIEKDGPGYHGYVPALPGCHTCGNTIEETRKNLREAIQCHLEGMLLAGEKISKDEGIELLETIAEEDLDVKPLPKLRAKLAYA